MNPDTSIEADVEAVLKGIALKSEDEIERARAEDAAARIRSLRRMAAFPHRAYAFAAEAEKRGGAEWWRNGTPWGLCCLRILEAMEAGATVALLGPQGRGKTTMAVAVGRAMTAREKGVRWGDVVGFVMSLQDAKAAGNQTREFREWESPAVLMLDQADKMPDAEWESRLLFRLVDQRYNARRATLLLCNVASENPKEWAADAAEKLGASIWDRIRETGGVELANWPVLRPTHGGGR